MSNVIKIQRPISVSRENLNFYFCSDWAFGFRALKLSIFTEVISPETA